MVADFDALTRVARQERCLSENTLLAYQRAWRRLLAWSGASKLDPVTLTSEQAARFYRDMVAATGRTAASSQGAGPRGAGLCLRAVGSAQPLCQGQASQE